MLREARLALRGFLRAPSYAVIAALTLSLGIGLSTSMFSVVEALLLHPLPLNEPARLVSVAQQQPGGESRPVAPANFLDWRRDSQQLTSLSAYRVLSRVVAGSAEPVRIPVASVSSNFLEVLGVQPSLGRGFSPRPQRPIEVVLSARLWRERFGGERGVLGRRLVLDTEPAVVVGVMPDRFTFPEAALAWNAAPADVPELLGFPGDIRALRDVRYFSVVGRLAPGSTLAAARAEMNGIGERLHRADAEANPVAAIRVLPLQDQLVGDSRTLVLLLLAAVGFLLLIACANVAHLVLARGLARQREVAIRAALGAGRSGLLGAQLWDAALLAGCGALGGMFLARASLAPLLALLPAGTPRRSEIEISAPVLLFAVGLAIVVTVVFGLLPLAATRRGRDDLALTLARGGRSTRGSRRLRALLVEGELALSLILVTGAGLMAKSLWTLEQVEPGFRSTGVVHLELASPHAAQFDASERQALARRIIERVAALPEFDSVGAAGDVPLSGPCASASLRVRGREMSALEAPDVCWNAASPGYFTTLAIPLLKGRGFNDLDLPTAAPVALVNRALAERMWPGGDPLGQEIGTGLDGRQVWARVVGVVGNTPTASLTEPPAPAMLRPLAQARGWGGDSLHLVAHAAHPDQAELALRDAVRAVAPDAALDGPRPLAALRGSALGRQRAITALLVLFAAVALVLAVVGLFGVVSYLVSERTAEFGLRMALGARPADIGRLVIRDALIQVGVGALVGVVGAAWLARGLESAIGRPTEVDPLTLGAVLALLALGGLVASYLPARRASGVDPLVSLRD